MLCSRVLSSSCVAVVASVVLAGGAEAKGPAKKLPDLEVRAKAPAKTVAPGEKVTLSLTLENAGRARAPATTTRISVGASATSFAKGDRVLATVRQKAVGRGGRTTARVTITVPASAAAAARASARAAAAAKAKPKSRYVLACADSGSRARESSEGDNCVRVARVDGKAAGTVDGQGAKTAAKPAATVATPPAPPGPVITAPTYMPPQYEPDPSKSCAEKTGPKPPDKTKIGSWDNKLFATAGTRVWWNTARPDLAAEADALGKELASTIYPKLTKLMGREPLSDEGMSCPHGSDGRLDIYLVDKIGDRGPGEVGPDGRSGTLGSTQPYGCWKGHGNPSYMYLARRDKLTLAHELFHVLQNLFPDKVDCARPGWLDEGTAEWAVEFVYPHSILDNNSANWLKDFKPSLFEKDYDAWPFWYDVAQQLGTDAIPQVYRLMADNKPIPATDAALTRAGETDQGGFRARWPEFARDAYNRDVVDNTFKTAAWTKTTTHVTDAPTQQALGTFETTKTVPLPGARALPALSRRYDIWTFDFPVRGITVQGLPTNPDFRLHALITYTNGGTDEVDVADGQTWCRDKPGQDVAEVVFVSSNASPTAPIASTAAVRLADSCGPPHYKILSASFDIKTKGHMDQDYCGTVKGTSDFGGSLAAPVTDPDFVLDHRYGEFSADLDFEVRADGLRTYEGCKTYKKLPCTWQGPWNPWYDKSRMGVLLRQGDGASQTATLRWLTHFAALGVIDYGDDNCNVFYFYNQVPQDEVTITIPADHLRRGTHTYSISKSRHWDVDMQTRKPASLDMDYTYHLTYQVVDDAGNPIE